VPNLASELSARHLTFAGYAESMPAPGYTGCSAGEYARKHNPWVDFPSVPTADSRTFAGFPGAHSTSGAYARLPTVSFVIPNLCDDMHDCSIGTGDAWLRARMDGYVRWARTHDSLFILTFDENDGANGNRIPLIIVGEHVRPGSYGEGVSHYTVLRTLEDAFGLPYAGHSVSVAPITNIWD
jgi:acid phosphatase